jgi:Fe-S cluster assembly scaffold protein SufB
LSVPPLKLPFLDEAAARNRSRLSDEPDWLLGERLDALRRAQALPAEANQLFIPYLDLRAARFAEIEPYAEAGIVPDADDGALPPGVSVLLHVREDMVVARALSPEAREAGVIVETFAEALRNHAALLRPLLEGSASVPETDAFAQVARALSTLGVFIHVPDGVSLAAPIVLRWSAGTPGRGLINRTVISLGADAHATLLEEQTDVDPQPAAEDAPTAAAPAVQSLWWGTVELHLGDSATLDVAGEQNFGKTTLAVVNRHATVGRGAALRWSLASVGSQLHRSRIDNLLVGRGSSVRQVEIGFGDGNQLFDLTSYTRHIGEDTTGDLLSKGVFLDTARGYIKGLIEIQQTARGTDSFLGEFSMLLTRKARSVTIPSLEIDQPDVRRASHSSSVGPIDETQIFYLMSRGVDRDTARKFIVLGFLEPVVARIPLPDAQDRLRALLEAKWPASAPIPNATAA